MLNTSYNKTVSKVYMPTMSNSLKFSMFQPALATLMGCISYNPPGSSSVGFNHQVYFLILQIIFSKCCFGRTVLYSSELSWTSEMWLCGGYFFIASITSLPITESNLSTAFNHFSATSTENSCFNHNYALFRRDVWFDFPLPPLGAYGRTAGGGHEKWSPRHHIQRDNIYGRFMGSDLSNNALMFINEEKKFEMSITSTL